MTWIDSHWVTVALVAATLLLLLSACQVPLR